MKTVALLFSFALAVLSLPQPASSYPATTSVGAANHKNQPVAEITAPAVQMQSTELEQALYPFACQSGLVRPGSIAVGTTNSITANREEHQSVTIQDDHPLTPSGRVATTILQNESAHSKQTVLIVPPYILIPDQRRQLN